MSRTQSTQQNITPISKLSQCTNELKHEMKDYLKCCWSIPYTSKNHWLTVICGLSFFPVMFMQRICSGLRLLSSATYSIHVYSQLPSLARGRFSFRNLRTCHAVVTGMHLTWPHRMYTIHNLRYSFMRR
jgi:hypothetical protein